MRIKFDEQLAQLNHELIAMGALCEEAIATTSRAVMDNDRNLNARVRELENQIDQNDNGDEQYAQQCVLDIDRDQNNSSFSCLWSIIPFLP